MIRKPKTLDDVLADIFIVANGVFVMGWTPYVWTRAIGAGLLLLFLCQKVFLWMIDEYRRIRAMAESAANRD